MQRAHPAPKRLRGPRRAGGWLLLFVVALALRVAYTWFANGPAAVPYSDSADYDRIAWNLAQGHGFAMGGGDAVAGAATWPTAYRPPLVPWLTSLVYRAFGHRYFAALLLQCVIGAFIPLVLRRFAAAVFGGQVALVAGW